MPSTEEERVYRAAVECFGIKAQVLHTCGELGELSAALVRYFGQCRGHGYAVMEEVADVEIMCGQLREILGGKIIDHVKAEKLAKLKSMLPESYLSEPQSKRRTESGRKME